MCKSDIKDTALVSRAKPLQIIGQAVQGLDEEGMAIVGRPSSLARMVQRYQTEISSCRINVNQISNNTTGITTGDVEPRPFLIYDTGVAEEGRVLIFASDECLRVLSRANIWFMDGNFSMAPRIFK